MMNYLIDEPVVVIIDDSSDEDTIQMVNSKAQNNEKENIHEKNINQSSAIASSLLSLSAAASMTTTTVIDLSQISTCKEEDTVVISSTTSSCSSSMNKASFSDDLESPPDKCSHVQDKSEQNHELDEQQQQQQRPSKRARLVADTIPFNLFQAQEQELLRFRRMKEQSKQKKDKTNCQKKDEKQKAILPTGINANVPSTSSKTSNDPAVPLEMKRTEPIKDIPTIIEKVTVPSELPTSLLKEESSGKHTEKVRPTFSEAKNVNKVHTKTVKRSRSSTNRVQHPRSENSNVSSNISRKQLSTSIKRCHFSQYIVPSTAWRGNRLKEEAPINLLPNDPSLKLPFAKGMSCVRVDFFFFDNHPFMYIITLCLLEYDVPLDVYDPSGLLKDKCAFVSSVKKSDNANLKVETQKEELLIPSAIVEELMQHQLPQIKQCYQRKVSTIVSETRKQVLSYLSASKKQLYLLQQKKRKHFICVSIIYYVL
jgi:hypothetical protein